MRYTVSVKDFSPCESIRGEAASILSYEVSISTSNPRAPGINRYDNTHTLGSIGGNHSVSLDAGQGHVMQDPTY
eukprot:2376449-Pyramimonas_sp.AAC.1